MSDDEIIEKIADYFLKNSAITYSTLDNFLIETDLITIFESNDEKDDFWYTGLQLHPGKSSLGKEECINTFKNFVEKADKSDFTQSKIYDITNKSNNTSFLPVRRDDQTNNFSFFKEIDNENLKFISNEEKLHRLKVIISKMDFKKYIEFRKVLTIINLNNLNYLSMNDIITIFQNYNMLTLNPKEIFEFLKFLDLSRGERGYDLILNQHYLKDIVQTLDQYLNPLYINAVLDSKQCKNGSMIEILEEIIKDEFQVLSYLKILGELCSQVTHILNNDVAESIEFVFEETKNEEVKNLMNNSLDEIFFKIQSIEFFCLNWTKNVSFSYTRMQNFKQEIFRYEDKIKSYEIQGSQGANDEGGISRGTLNMINDYVTQNTELISANEEKSKRINILIETIEQKDKLIFNLNDKITHLKEVKHRYRESYEMTEKKLSELKSKYESEKKELSNDEDDSFPIINPNLIKRSFTIIQANKQLLIESADVDFEKLKLEKKIDELIKNLQIYESQFKTLNEKVNETEVLRKLDLALIEEKTKKIEKQKGKISKLKRDNAILVNNVNELNQKLEIKTRGQSCKNLIATFGKDYSVLNIFDKQNYSRQDINFEQGIGMDDNNVFIFEGENENKIERLSVMETSFANVRQPDKIKTQIEESFIISKEIPRFLTPRKNKIENRKTKNRFLSQNNEAIQKILENITNVRESTINFSIVANKNHNLIEKQLIIRDTHQELKIESKRFEIIGKMKLIGGIDNYRFSLGCNDNDFKAVLEKNCQDIENGIENKDPVIQIVEESYNNISKFTLNENETRIQKTENFEEMNLRRPIIIDGIKNFQQSEIMDESKINEKAEFAKINNLEEYIQRESKMKRLNLDDLLENIRQSSRKLVNLIDTPNGENQDIFVFSISVIESRGVKNKRILMIKKSNIYLLLEENYHIEKKISLKRLENISISTKIPNMIVFHFRKEDDLIIEILNRISLLVYLRDIFVQSNRLIPMKEIDDNFEIKKKGKSKKVLINKISKLFYSQSFENAQKIGVLEKYSKGFFSYQFKKKLVVLSDIGMFYFDTETSTQPKMLIPILGSVISKVEESRFKKKNCFEIKTNQEESFIFSAITLEETNSWLDAISSFTDKCRNNLKRAETSRT